MTADAAGGGAGGEDDRGIIHETAAAKLNLYLHVTGRRGDGYHLLDSLVVFAGVGDELRFLPSDGLKMTVSGPFAGAVPAGADNLVLAAARALAARAARGAGAGVVNAGGAAAGAGLGNAAGAGLGNTAGAGHTAGAGNTAGAAIELSKNLPVAAGLGGGSADAAAALRGLARLWGVKPGEGELHELALSLGADVPVCLASRPAFMRGIGDDLSPARGLPALPLLLVNPGVALSTPAVFAARRGAFQTAAGDWPGGGLEAFAAWLNGRENGLEAAALALAPEIGAVLTRLRGQAGCLLARLSGSGASCFGLFAEPASRDLAAAEIARAEPAWWLAPAACPAVD